MIKNIFMIKEYSITCSKELQHLSILVLDQKESNNSLLSEEMDSHSVGELSQNWDIDLKYNGLSTIKQVHMK